MKTPLLESDLMLAGLSNTFFKKHPRLTASEPKTLANNFLYSVCRPDKTSRALFASKYTAFLLF